MTMSEDTNIPTIDVKKYGGKQVAKMPSPKMGTEAESGSSTT
jgi:hypothetical protein